MAFGVIWFLCAAAGSLQAPQHLPTGEKVAHCLTVFKYRLLQGVTHPHWPFFPRCICTTRFLNLSKMCDFLWVFVHRVLGPWSSSCFRFYFNRRKKRNFEVLIKESHLIGLLFDQMLANTITTTILSAEHFFCFFLSNLSALPFVPLGWRLNILPRNNWRSVSRISISHDLIEHWDH